VLAPELLSRIRRLELKAGHLASEILLGEYKSAFKGRGWEFDEVREYQVGDEIRSIDWNVTARMGQPFVKLFREEREMTLMLAPRGCQFLAVLRQFGQGQARAGRGTRGCARLPRYSASG
jgi:hypothetical protein